MLVNKPFSNLLTDSKFKTVKEVSNDCHVHYLRKWQEKANKSGNDWEVKMRDMLATDAWQLLG